MYIQRGKERTKREIKEEGNKNCFTFGSNIVSDWRLSFSLFLCSFNNVSSVTQLTYGGMINGRE
jgi:hypothetical protein